MVEYVEIDAQELNDYISNLEDENEALKAQVEQLNDLLVCMQNRACLFLQPNGEDEKDFINFVIGVLDGPEQRLAQSTPAQCLAEVKALAVIDAIDEHKNKLLTFDFDTAIRVSDLVRYANQLRQQAKEQK